MEPNTSNTAKQSSSPIIPLIVILVILGVIAFVAFNAMKGSESPAMDTAPEVVEVATSTPVEDEQVIEAEIQEGDVRPDGTRALTGSIVEVITRPESDDRWITLVHTDAQSDLFEYKFYISADSEVSAPIEGGSRVEVSFIGDPSTTDFVLVRSVTSIE